MKRSIHRSAARHKTVTEAKVRFCFFSVMRRSPLAGELFSEQLQAPRWMINYPAEGLFAGAQDG
jgi:hypothetical protein